MEFNKIKLHFNFVEKLVDFNIIKVYINFVKNVKVYYKYSHDTADALVAAEDIEIAIEASSGVATLTVGIFTTTINVTFEPIPEYFVEEVVNETTGNAYAIDGAKLLVFTDVMASKKLSSKFKSQQSPISKVSFLSLIAL